MDHQPHLSDPQGPSPPPSFLGPGVMPLHLKVSKVPRCPFSPGSTLPLATAVPSCPPTCPLLSPILSLLVWVPAPHPHKILANAKPAGTPTSSGKTSRLFPEPGWLSRPPSGHTPGEVVLTRMSRSMTPNEPALTTLLVTHTHHPPNSHPHLSPSQV